MRKISCLLLLLFIHADLIAQSNFIGPGISLQNNGATGKYVDLGDVFNTLDFPMTFEAWIKPESVPPIVYGIFTTENDNSVYSGLWIRFTSIKGIEFEIGDGLGNGPGYRRGFRTTTTMQLSKWTHVAIVANSITDVKFYFNGKEVNQVPSDGGSAVINMVSSSYSASIARHFNFFSDLYFDGAIDEVRLWNISRTEGEIRDNMCKKITNSPAGLIGYWKIDESYSSSSVLDYALPSEDGIVVGGINKVTSGAPIGDESKYVYTSNWAGITVGLGSSVGDSLSVSSINNSTNGMQVYRVDSLPYNSLGLDCPVPLYFGAFGVANNNNTTYKTTYYYNYNNGIINALNENQATLFKHADAATLSWTNSTATLNTVLDNLEKENETYRAEYILNVPVNLQVSADTIICAGDSVQLFASGASSYLWSPATGLSCITCDNPIASPSVTTNYVVTAINGSCTKSDTIVITAISSLTLTVTPDTTLCNGDSIQLFVSGALNYTWSPTIDLSCTNCSNPYASPTTNTTYFVIGNLGSCIDTATIDIEVNSIPSLILSVSDTTVCAGNAVQLTVSGANSYSWNPSIGLNCDDCANPIATPSVTTSYYVTGTNANCSTIDSVTITVDSPVSLLITPDTAICMGDSILLSASGATTYNWSPSIGLTCTTCSNPFASPLSNITYTVIATSGSCTDTASVNIQVDSIPSLVLSNDTIICAGNSVQLIALGANDYSWSPSTGLSCIDCPDPLATPSSTITYFVTGTNANCADFDSVSITVNPAISLVVTPDTAICIGNSIALFAFGASNYSWNPSTGLSCTNCSNPVADPTFSISYTVVASSGACSDTASIYIQVDSMPSLIVSGDTSICIGDQIQLMASGANSYSWNPSMGLSCSDCADPFASPVINTIYTVTGYNGVCSETASLTVEVGELNIDAGESQTIGEGSSVQLSGSGADTYSWSPNNSLNDSNSATPVANPLQTTTYTLTGSGNGCTKSDTVTIIVVDPCKYVMIPTAFSPNNDGINDQLKILSIGDFALKYFKIFNRWGELVFETTTPSAGWDGTYKGSFQQVGTYIFIASFYCKGVEHIKKGNVTLLR